MSDQKVSKFVPKTKAIINPIIIKHPSGKTFAVDPNAMGEGSFGSFHYAIYSEGGQQPFGIKYIKDKTQFLPREWEAEKLLYGESEWFKPVDANEVKQFTQSSKQFPSGGKFIFKPLFEGKPLYKISQGALDQLSPADRLHLVAELAEQLKLLHENDVGHFDLKNDNVIVNLSKSPPTLRIIDFSFADTLPNPQNLKELKSNRNATYYAPEATRLGSADGRPKIGLATDVYMMNNIALYLLRVPDPLANKRFNKNASDAVKRAHIRSPFAKAGLLDLPQGMSAEDRDVLTHFIARTENLNPKQRPTMAEVADFYRAFANLTQAYEGAPSTEKEQQKVVARAQLQVIEAGLWDLKYLITQEYPFSFAQELKRMPPLEKLAVYEQMQTHKVLLSTVLGADQYQAAEKTILPHVTDLLEFSQGTLAKEDKLKKATPPTESKSTYQGLLSHFKPAPKPQKEEVKKNPVQHLKKAPLLLHQAIYQDDMKELTRLINSNTVNLDLQDNHGNTALHLLIAKAENPELIESIIEKGADINIANTFGDTPLHMAIRQNDFEVAEALISAQAKVDLPNMFGVTARQLLQKTNVPESQALLQQIAQDPQTVPERTLLFN